MDEDDYEAMTRKPLKLGSKKDKKKKENTTSASSMTEGSKIIVATVTEAEKAFKAKQEKIAEGRILEKASKTHKQRVEEFNKHLDSLSEHYDIPKVSWTK